MCRALSRGLALRGERLSPTLRPAELETLVRLLAVAHHNAGAEIEHIARATNKRAAHHFTLAQSLLRAARARATLAQIVQIISPQPGARYASNMVAKK